jgi:hypothetical protein
VAAALEDDPPAAAALEDDDDELDEHPAISAAAAPISKHVPHRSLSRERPLKPAHVDLAWLG